MNRSVDLTALSWCLAEIRESLARAETALEQHLQGGGGDDDGARLRAARGWLHQAHGALQVVDLEGVSAITQEAERLLDRADRGELALNGEMASALARAFAAVVEFLEGLVGGSGDSPVSLFPHYRDLLALAGAERVEPADLYSVDLTVRPPRADRGEALSDAAAAAARSEFERGLLLFLRNPRDADGLGGMFQAIERLNRVHQASGQRTFWWLAAAFFDALRVQALPVDLHAKRLVARINLQIRRSLSAQAAPIADRMLKDLLFLLARTGNGSARADEARRLYRLAGTVPPDFETPRYGLVDARTLRAARDATQVAKAAWEKFVRGGAHELAGFATAAQQLDGSVQRLPWPGLQRLAGTMVGLRRALAAAGAPLVDVLSLETATALLFVEQTLERGSRAAAQHDRRAAELAERLDRLCEQQRADDTSAPEWLAELSRAAQDRLTSAAFVSELLANLRGCEKVLDAFFREPAQRSELPSLPPLLQQVSGALRLLGHDEAAAGADAVSRQVVEFADAADPPSPRDCERVAASLGALGFFAETLQQPGRTGGGFEFVNDEGGFVARLGERTAPAANDDEPAEPPPQVPERVVPFDVSAPVVPPAVPAIAPDRSLEVQLRERRGRLAAQYQAYATAPGDAGARTALRDALATIRDEAMLVEDAALRSDAGDALALLDADAVPAALEPVVARVSGDAVAPAAEVPADDAIDAELLEIFLGEADEVLAAVDLHCGQSQAAPSDIGHLTTLRRAFHTLKGSSRMVGLTEFGEAGWVMEQVLNGWLADERAGTPALYALIADAHREMNDWVARLRADARARIDPSLLVARAVAMRDGVEAPPALPTVAAAAPAPSAGELAPPPAEALSIDAVDPEFLARAAVPEPGEELVELSEVLDPIALEGAAPVSLDAFDTGRVPDAGSDDDAPDDTADGEVTVGERRLSAALYRIFLAEAEQLLGRLDASLARWRAMPAIAAPEESVRAVHSLAGTSRLVGLDGVHGSADALERFMLSQSLSGQGLQPRDLDDFAAVLDGLHDAMRRFAAGEDPPADAALDARAEALAERWAALGAPDSIELREAALDEDDAIELREAALDADDAPPVALVADPGFAPASDAAPTPVEPHVVPPERADEASAVAPIDERPAAPVASAPVDPAPAAAAPPPQGVSAPTTSVPQPAAPAPASAAPAAAPAATTTGGVDGLAALVDDIDPELAPVFIEEADELLPRIGEALRAWAASPVDTSLPASLMRLLHTVKGSARMAGAMRLGQLVHDMETRIEAASALPKVPAALIDDLIARGDQVLTLYEAVRDPQSAAAQAAAAAVVAALTRDAGADATHATGAPSPAADAARDAAPGAAGADEAAGAVQRQPAQTLIRVRADLLDRLVNEAGEVSIARARLDNALGGIRQSLTELTENVNRLRTQLREIELAADSQIQARNAKSREEAQFDPLEFDRYTRFQELTRMLAESVSDVATVQQNALRNLDDAGRDLGRQGQVTRDLQQDLMRIRMVQFGSIADRLYRVVRQAAKEMDKRVSLDLKGANAELDRSVLERMVGPIEHLLRNAVAHGIEARAARAAAGKAETGEITLDVRAEANEVILVFADDGKGLDYARIRARAIERGLVDADAALGERELGQLIFMPGFTTATEVTTLAGRGVGMDVVRAEVAAMGGRIDLQSTPGAGTRFTVHLPVSLAVTQVVLLTVGEVRIAVASALIEQVLQMKPEALADAYAHHRVEWHGEAVPLYFLGSVLELPGNTPLAQRYSPVVVLRSGHQRIALHVDHVAPSQEVVVKHVGPQLARLTGMAGATVLGNGEIVLIMNPVQIVASGRGAQAGQGDTATFAPTQIEIAPTVMVVDDSVTVRKVTQRMLLREGYQVMLAKDGVDAMRQLQDAIPDVMLLDIEMPRMDGFDLTRNIRGDERLRGIPIVMITSRTADKHRNHALSLGVDEFLGKPYDEADLLRHVKALVARGQAAAGGAAVVVEQRP